MIEETGRPGDRGTGGGEDERASGRTDERTRSVQSEWIARRSFDKLSMTLPCRRESSVLSEGGARRAFTPFRMTLQQMHKCFCLGKFAVYRFFAIFALHNAVNTN